MSKNYIPEIAKMLGVEMDEVFHLPAMACDCRFHDKSFQYFDEQNMALCVANGRNNYGKE